MATSNIFPIFATFIITVLKILQQQIKTNFPSNDIRVIKEIVKRHIRIIR